MQKYKVIGSSSAGNAVIYFDELLVDIGLNYTTLKKHLKNINIILLTHEHGDHFSLTTLNLIFRERPDIFWVIPRHLYHKVENLNIPHMLIIENNKKYKIGDFKIEAFELFHDVANVGYKIIKNNYKIIHATDTVKIDHIEAKDFDLYAIEHNYDEEDINLRIIEKEQANMFAYESRSRDSHLSFQKAEDWINSQKKDSSQIIKLHVSSYYAKKEEEINNE